MVELLTMIVVLNLALVLFTWEDVRNKKADTWGWVAIVAVFGVLGAMLYHVLADREPLDEPDGVAG